MSQPIPAAYKHADGKKIDGRRVLVDVERGRTVKGWLPRRLGEYERETAELRLMLTLAGGGLGSTRKGGADVNVRHSGRDDRGRDRSRERDRDRDRRRDRSRSKDRRKRSRSRERGRRDRSRSRDRRRRSRSRDRKRSKRSRSRSRDRERRRERRDKAERGGGAGGEGDGFRVKEEPADSGYNDQYGNSFDYQGVNVKQEKLEEENGEAANGSNHDGQEAQYDGY